MKDAIRLAEHFSKQRDEVFADSIEKTSYNCLLILMQVINMLQKKCVHAFFIHRIYNRIQKHMSDQIKTLIC